MSVSEYQIIVYSKAGVQQSMIVDFYDLYYINRRNSVGICQFELDYAHPAVASITDKCFVEIKRRNKDLGLGWYTDYYGMIRSIEKEKMPEQTRVVVRALSLLHFLEWRIAAYYADHEGTSCFTSCPAEKVMKSLVRLNCTASATVVAGRVRSGCITGASITIQSGCTGGSTVTWAGAWEQLLPNLQQLSDDGGGDFDLIKTSSGVFDFRFYSGQRGTDRTSEVTFSLLYGNMSDISYTMDWGKESTIAIVGGRGQTVDRVTLVASGVNYSASNDIETFVNATGGSSQSYYQREGNQAVAEKKAKAVLGFTPVQTENCFYGLDYTWGDKIKAVFEDYSACMLVDAVTVRVHKEGGDGIEIELKEV